MERRSWTLAQELQIDRGWVRDGWSWRSSTSGILYARSHPEQCVEGPLLTLSAGRCYESRTGNSMKAQVNGINIAYDDVGTGLPIRSEERRVGKECRARGARC